MSEKPILSKEMLFFIIACIFLVISSVLYYTKPQEVQYVEPTETPRDIIITLMPIRIENESLEEYLLEEHFMKEISEFTEEELKIAEQFHSCIESVFEASINPRYARVVLYCWGELIHVLND